MPVMRAAGRTRFGSAIALVGLCLLTAGGYAYLRGRATLAWPRAEAEILASRVELREGVRRDMGHTVRTETASFHVRYHYRALGRDYEGGGVEPYDFGMQNSARSREQGAAYSPGQRVAVAYDPADPAISYLAPGPSSTATLFTALGAGATLLGLWLRHASSRRNARRSA